MGLREGLSQHRAIAVGAACGLIVVGLVMTAMQMRRGSTVAQGAPSGRFFYSADDGKTWFVDDSTKIPPFLKDGKEAVRAYVYRTKDGKEFVGLLERYSLAGKKKIEADAARAAANPLLMEDNSMAAAEALQWKKPGEKTWISASDPRVATVTTVVSPNGASDTVTPVTPG